MIVVNLKEVSKYYGVTQILDQIDFTVQEGEKIGIIGVNGAGKSTLFKIITGELSYEEGTLARAKQLSIGYLEQSDRYERDVTLYDFCLESFKDLRAMEGRLRTLEQEIASNPTNKGLMEEYAQLTEAFEQAQGYAYESRTRGVLFGLGFGEDEFTRTLDTLSGGERTRMQLAKLLLHDYDLLLLDEPTNHLDLKAMKWLEGYITNYKGAVLLISHDRYFLDHTATAIFELERMKGKRYPGNYSQYMERKRRDYEEQTKKYKLMQQQMKKEEELIRTFRQRSHLNGAWTKKAEDREKKLARIEQVEEPFWLNKKMHLHFDVTTKSGDHVLEMINLSKSFDNKEIFSQVSGHVYRKDRVGIIGRNGIGKSTLLKILVGLIDQDGGHFHFGHQVTTSYYDQELSTLTYQHSLVDEIADLMPHLDETKIRTYLGSFLFTGDEVFLPIEKLSGGEKARLSLLKLMLTGNNTLLLDEPTNHLDILSKETLEAAIKSYDGTVIAVSHDRYFLNSVCNKIFELTPEGLKTYLGNYDYYEFKAHEEEMMQTDLESTAKEGKTQRKERLRKEREESKERKEKEKAFKKLEEELHDLEDKIELLTHQMALEENYTDPEKLRDLTKEVENLKKTLEKKYEIWENLL